MKTSLLHTLAVAALALALPAHALIISYSYDTAGRLTVANYGGASNTAYAYDANGNLLARTNSTNKFIPLIGSYAGLVTGGTATALNTGLITLTVASNGAFTGSLKLGATTFKLKGTFDMTTGAATLTLTRKTPPGTLTLDLQLDLDSTGQLTGTISGGETATLLATLTPFGKKAPAPGGLVGAYTALFEPTQTGTTIPHGDGFAKVSVTAAGAVKMAGTLADGSKLSLGTVLAGDGSLSLFGSLYKGGGFVTGTVTFATTPGVSDFASAPPLAWKKPATTGPIYPAFFDTELNLIGSKYAKPAKGQRVLDFANTTPNAELTASGGNSTAIDKLVTLEVTNKFNIPSDAVKLKLAITTSSGLLGGSFFDAGTSKTRKLKGVVFQQADRGAGFFLGDSESGAFDLATPP
jgi:YD repeat-containing protein